MASWTDASYLHKGKLEVQWNGVSWTDESVNLLAAGGRQSMLDMAQMAGGVTPQEPWAASFEMYNNADRYSPLNSGGALYSDIGTNKGHGIAIRYSAGIDDGGGGFTYTQIFTGYIDSIDLTSTRQDRATFTCLDNAHPLLQRKVTTTMYLDQYADDWLTVLATEAGVASTDLDSGLFEIPFCWCDDENSWTEMNKIANADGGWLFFDKDGTLTFENAEAWAADSRHNSSQHSFTVSRANDFNIPFRWQDVYNEIIVEYAPRIQKGQVVLYELDEVVSVLPGDTQSIIARLRYPAPSINAPTANKDYRVVAMAGEDLSASVTVTLTKYAQRVETDLQNNHAFHLAYFQGFRLTGRPLQGYQALEEKLQATDSDIGDPTSAAAKTLRVSGNEYIQSAEQARFLCRLLRDRVKIARQVYVARDVPAIPTLQPGDRVTCVEAGSGLNNDGFITSISWRYGGGTYRADYEIIDASSWFLYTDSQYFLLGTDTMTAGTSDRAWY